MKNNKPTIGVTPWYDYEKQTTYIKKGYCEGIIKSGGLPVLLPLVSDEDLLQEAFEKIDGLLLSGGPDVDPKYYGENNMICNGTISPYRDVMEMYLARKAITENKPVFGICRGIQVMNTAMGGSLYQDIHSQIQDSKLIKHSQEAPKWYGTHKVSIESSSLVGKACGKDTVEVNSYHHQAIKEPAQGFTVIARSPDGVIEAIEVKGHKFALGVQWHPELMWQENEMHLSLFVDFVRSCRL